MYGAKKLFFCFIITISIYIVYMYAKTAENDFNRRAKSFGNHHIPLVPSNVMQNSSKLNLGNTSDVIRKSRKAPENLKCPRGNVLTVVTGGQLGNKIWEYMSLYSAYNLYKNSCNLEAFVPWAIKKNIEWVFDKTSLPVFESIPVECKVRQRKKITIDYHSLISKDKLPEKEEVLIELIKWSARYEFVVPFGFENIKKELRFKNYYVKNAQQNLHEIKKKFYNEDETDVVFVGMHHRGTDMIRLMRRYLKENIFKPPSYEYFNAAITYFQQKYKKLIFVLITIDSKWLQDNKEFFKKDVNLVINPIQPQHPINDMSLLSHCNHSIMTYGTFAATAALYAGGNTFVYDLGISTEFDGPTLTMGLVEMLPNWYRIRNQDDLIAQGLLSGIEDGPT